MTSEIIHIIIIVLSHGCIAQAHYLSSYSNQLLWLASFLGFYSYLSSSSGAYPTRAAAKISAVGEGALRG